MGKLTDRGLAKPDDPIYTGDLVVSIRTPRSLALRSHRLASGVLTDAPGRNESWEERLRYFGHDRWELNCKGSDYTGLGKAYEHIETMTTEELVKWVIKRADEEWQIGARRGKLGKRGPALRKICKSENASHCIEILDAAQKGTWPEKEKVTLLDVTRQTTLRAWRGTTPWVVYEVKTDKGPGHLYPLRENNQAKLVLFGEPTASEGRMVDVPAELLAKIDALKHA